MAGITKIRSGKMRYVYNSIDASGLSFALVRVYLILINLVADVVISSSVIRATRGHIYDAYA